MKAIKDPILLGSGSVIRKRLLDEAKIQYIPTYHTSDEAVEPGTLREMTSTVAVGKMDKIVIPEDVPKDRPLFALTVDTLCMNWDGTIVGKPADRAEAIKNIGMLNNKVLKAGSSFCLDRKVYKDGRWETDARIVDYDEATCMFEIPDQWVDRYLNETTAMKAAGSATAEEFGAQFVRSVEGCYYSLLGVPMFELRQALEQLGYFV